MYKNVLLFIMNILHGPFAVDRYDGFEMLNPNWVPDQSRILRCCCNNKSSNQNKHIKPNNNQPQYQTTLQIITIDKYIYQHAIINNYNAIVIYTNTNIHQHIYDSLLMIRRRCSCLLDYYSDKTTKLLYDTITLYILVNYIILCILILYIALYILTTINHNIYKCTNERTNKPTNNNEQTNKKLS
jgi:hypothetical protein